MEINLPHFRGVLLQNFSFQCIEENKETLIMSRYFFLEGKKERCIRGISWFGKPSSERWGRRFKYKEQHVAQQKLSGNDQLVSSMKLNPQLVSQLVFLSLYCVLTTVRESNSAFVPGRCLCPRTQPGVRGQLKDLSVMAKTASCSNVTVMVTLKRNNVKVCLDPEAAMGKQLIRCWNRAQKLGRDLKLCLKRRRGKGGRRQQPRQRRGGHKKHNPETPNT
ncbi:uncharacterized protein cxcl-c13b [Odontesthes bonariensis]